MSEDQDKKPGERKLTQLQTLQIGEILLKDDSLRKEKRILDLERANIDLRAQLWVLRLDAHEQDAKSLYEKLGIKRGQRLEILEGGILRVKE